MTAYKTPLGWSRFRIGDMIIMESHSRGVAPKRLISHIFEPYDPTTPTFSRNFFGPLLKVHREAILKFGVLFERIRCSDCGARKIPRALTGGRCEKCHEVYAAIPWDDRSTTVHYNPDDPNPWPDRRGRYS